MSYDSLRDKKSASILLLFLQKGQMRERCKLFVKGISPSKDLFSFWLHPLRSPTQRAHISLRTERETASRAWLGSFHTRKGRIRPATRSPRKSRKSRLLSRLLSSPLLPFPSPKRAVTVRSNSLSPPVFVERRLETACAAYVCARARVCALTINITNNGHTIRHTRDRKRRNGAGGEALKVSHSVDHATMGRVLGEVSPAWDVGHSGPEHDRSGGGGAGLTRAEKKQCRQSGRARQKNGRQLVPLE